MINLAANDPLDALLLASIQAFERGDVESLAFAVLRAADFGFSSPGLVLGTSLLHLEGVSAATGRRVVELLKEEAERCENPAAQYALAFIYSAGALGAVQDECLAYDYFVRAEKFGMKEISIILGFLSDQGIGCQRDEVSARRWFGKAAEEGFLYGQAKSVKMDSSIGVVRRSIALLGISFRAFAIALRNPSDSRLFFLNSHAKLFPDHAPPSDKVNIPK